MLVEPERELAATVSRLLAAERFEIEVAADGETGFAKASSDGFDLIILDSMLPLRSGFTVCRDLRKIGVDTSVLMLSSKTRAEERIAALRLGADDCVPRCCDPNELMARVEAILRRAPKMRRTVPSTLRFGDVQIDFASSEALKGTHPVGLSEKELRLLHYLVGHQDKVVTRKELLSEVRGYDASVSSRTIDVHVGWLRQKLEDDPRQPKHIKTIRGSGYRFDW